MTTTPSQASGGTPAGLSDGLPPRTPGGASSPVPPGTAHAVERLKAWTRGYRALMPHLDSTVHPACTSVSELSDGTFAHLDIDDVEALLPVLEAAEALLPIEDEYYESKHYRRAKSPGFVDAMVRAGKAHRRSVAALRAAVREARGGAS